MPDNPTNGNGAKAEKPTPASPKEYTVLTAKSPHEVVLTGKFNTAPEAFEAAVAKTGGIQDGEAANYIVVASRFLVPRTAKVEVKRKLIFA